MGRNREIGLKYFPFDVDTFSDIKIRKLIKYQGGKSVTVYALLLCLIYKRGYYMRWDEELPFIISEQTGFEEAYILEVIKSCLALDLFSKELYDSDKVLTSKGIQTRYAEVMNLFRRKTEISAFSLIYSEKKAISSAFMTINPIETPRKEREEKVKEKKETNFVGKETTSSSPILKNSKRSFEENMEECLKDQVWREMVQMNLGVRITDWQGMFYRFRANLISNGQDTDKSRPDFRQHFMNWLRIQKQNEDGKHSQKNMGRNVSAGGVQSFSRPQIAPAKIVAGNRGRSCI